MVSSALTKKELLSSLSAYKYAANFLSTSNKPGDVEQMDKILDKLHQFRRTHPQQQDVINQTLFDIFDHAYYRSHDYMRQRIQIGVICGFAQNMPSDMETIQQIMNRTILSENPQYMSFAFKTIAQKAIDTYKNQNYKSQDSASTTAHRLKNMLYIIGDFSKHKNITEKKWLHDAATQLAKEQPDFKKIKKDFPEPPAKKRASKILPKEPAFVFPKSRKILHRFSSRSYE